MSFYRELHINGCVFEYHTGKSGVKIKLPQNKGSAFFHYKEMYDVIYDEETGTATSEVTPEIIQTNIIAKLDTTALCS